VGDGEERLPLYLLDPDEDLLLVAGGAEKAGLAGVESVNIEPPSECLASRQTRFYPSTTELPSVVSVAVAPRSLILPEGCVIQGHRQGGPGGAPCPARVSRHREARSTRSASARVPFQ
jgi:hypothetical protein